jgi:hypothetical protein
LITFTLLTMPRWREGRIVEKHLMYHNASFMQQIGWSSPASVDRGFLAHQRDVGGERQRLHLPRLEQVILRDRTQRQRAVG